jgi:CubicO group peptidase (beta-lactamase class C family)
VRAAFAANFREEGETGAAVCAIANGRCVVDLWGGFSDAEATRPWRRDTLVNVFSAGKGVLCMLALRSVEDGELALDAPLADHWPEFAAEGKARVTLRWLLAHRAGLPAVSETLAAEAMYDWPRMCAALAAQRPYWEPDCAHGYHVNTWGFLVGELLRRAAGRPVAELLATRLGPTSDFWLGVPAREQSRIAHTCLPAWQPSSPAEVSAIFPPTGDEARDAMIWNAYFNPPGLSGSGTVNTRAWREAVIPSTNAHGNARGLARFYAAFLADASPALRAEATSNHSEGEDLVLGRPSRFGLGFQLQRPGRSLGPSAAAFGHFGHGGSLGMADPDAQLAFAYVTHRPGARFRSPRTDRLLAALYASL